MNTTSFEESKKKASDRDRGQQNENKPLTPVALLEGSELIKKSTPGSSGYDLVAREGIVLAPGETKLISTGLLVAPPEGYEIQIRPRSGRSLKSRLVVANAPGTIDSDYRDELKIIVRNDFCQWELATLLATRSPLLKQFGVPSGTISLKEWIALHPAQYGQDELMKAFLERGWGVEERLLLAQDGHLWGSIVIEAGERIAQAVLTKSYDMDWDEMTPEAFKAFGTNRGGGFGHTGQ